MPNSKSAWMAKIEDFQIRWSRMQLPERSFRVFELGFLGYYCDLPGVMKTINRPLGFSISNLTFCIVIMTK